MPPRLPVFVINRDVDQRRWARIAPMIEADPAARLIRVPAVDAYAPGFDPDARATEIFDTARAEPDKPWMRPMLAVFASHARCWHRIAGGLSTHALVLEDDAILLRPLKGLAEEVAAHADAEFFYVNRRSHALRALAPPPEPGGEPVPDWYARAGAALGNRFAYVRTRSDGAVLHPAGTDGYVLSRRGAARLAAGVRTIARLQYVDYTVFSAAVGATALGGPGPQYEHLHMIWERLGRPPLELEARFTTVHYTNADDRDVGGSVREPLPAA